MTSNRPRCHCLHRRTVGLSAIPSYGRAITSYCRLIISSPLAIARYGRAMTSYCRPILSYQLALTS